MIVGTTTTSSSSGGRHISERTHTVCAKEVTKKPVSINWQWSKKYRLHYIILLFFFRQLSFPCHQWLVLKSLEVPKWVSNTSKKRNTTLIEEGEGNFFLSSYWQEKQRDGKLLSTRQNKSLYRKKNYVRTIRILQNFNNTYEDNLLKKLLQAYVLIFIWKHG